MITEDRRSPGAGGEIDEDAEGAAVEAVMSQVGEVLRAVRRRKRLSLHEVEAATGQEFKASVLGAYERGERAISVPRLQRLSRFYGISVGELFSDDGGEVDAPDIDLVTVEQQATTEGAAVTIDLTKLGSRSAPEGDLLTRYLMMIVTRRRGFQGSALTIRSEDVSTIAALLEVRVDSLRRRLDELGLLAASPSHR